MDTTEYSPEEDPVLDGQVDEVGGTEDDVPVIDIDALGDHYVTVKVDGEDVRVPLSEAVAGYSRQADYTRKTQELAQQRQELQWASAIRAALENDPAGTIDLLADHYGVSRKEAQRMVDEDPYLTDTHYGMEDPVAKRLAEIDTRVSAFEKMQAQQRLEAEIERLQAAYGEDFNAQEVVSAALAQGSTNLEAVFKQIAFDRIATRRKVEAEKTSAKTEAKRTAAVVSGATSAKTAKDDAGPIRSIVDAYNAAKRTLGQ